jgi:peptidyl-prolyl cis-trans isomerase B (cyclophilin B)
MTKLHFSILIFFFLFAGLTGNAQNEDRVRKKDRKKLVLVITDAGSMILKLSDATPLHRDNFLRLVSAKYYDSLLFHRVIKEFMIQTGDPLSKRAPLADTLGSGGPTYTLPAEFDTSLFHKRGAVAAAREGDEHNPDKSSSGSQWYIVQGKVYSDQFLDDIERVFKRTIPRDQRETYKTIGGAPWLDRDYTVFGEVIYGLEIVDTIAKVKTGELDRPLRDVYILRMRLIKPKQMKKYMKDSTAKIKR